MKKYVISFLVVILFITLASSSLGSFQQRECVNIRTILNTTSVNLSTVSFPNSTIAISNEPMIDIGDSTFTFEFCDTSVIGVYIYGYVDAIGNSFVNDFEITKNGFQITTGEAVLYLVLFITNLIIFALFLFLTIITPFDNITEPQKNGMTAVIKVTKSKYMKIIAAWFTYGAFLFFITLLTGITQNYINFIELKSLMTNVYTFTYFLGFGVTMAVLWLIFYWSWLDIVFNRQIIKSGKAFMKRMET